jgi:nicotinamide mononucleotide adenylyltransferase
MGEWARACVSHDRQAWDFAMMSSTVLARKIVGTLIMAISDEDPEDTRESVERVGYDLRVWRKMLDARWPREEAAVDISGEQRLWAVIALVSEEMSHATGQEWLAQMCRNAEAELRQWWYENRESEATAEEKKAVSARKVLRHAWWEDVKRRREQIDMERRERSWR